MNIVHNNFPRYVPPVNNGILTNMASGPAWMVMEPFVFSQPRIGNSELHFCLYFDGQSCKEIPCSQGPTTKFTSNLTEIDDGWVYITKDSNSNRIFVNSPLSGVEEDTLYYSYSSTGSDDTLQPLQTYEMRKFKETYVFPSSSGSVTVTGSQTLSDDDVPYLYILQNITGSFNVYSNDSTLVYTSNNESSVTFWAINCRIDGNCSFNFLRIPIVVQGSGGE